MSDLMLYGVLRMPYDMAMESAISRIQFYGRVQQCADRCEAAEALVAAQIATIDTLTREKLAAETRAAQLSDLLVVSEAEASTTVDRYQWLANRVLACDYGDNEHGRKIGWRIRHDLLANGGRQPAFMYGKSINEAVDAEREKEKS